MGTEADMTTPLDCRLMIVDFRFGNADYSLVLVRNQIKSLVRNSREGGNQEEKETWIPDQVGDDN
jgi:hypothetical protein